MERARDGERHDCYNGLRYDIKGKRNESAYRIGMIVKIRGGWLDLNANVGRK